MKEVSGKLVYESLPEIIQPKHTAWVMVDVINDFYASEGYFAKGGADVSMLEESLPRMTQLLKVGRESGVTVIHIQNVILPNAVSESGPILRFRDRTLDAAPEYCLPGTWGGDFAAGMEPQENEVVVTKHRPDGFVGSDLDQILKSNKIESVVIGGWVTEGCVQATAIGALFHDFYPVVVSDCVATYSKEWHDYGLKFMGTRMDVVPLDEVIEVLEGQ
jgi:nicotinamidase-related amidase